MPRVLIAESFVVLRAVLEKILRDGGHHVECAAMTRDIVEAICNRPLDLLLIDLDMSKCGGLGTVRYIRRLECGRDIRVLALTNRGDREYILESYKAGVTTLLLKESCTAEGLLERVKELGDAARLTAPPSDTRAIPKASVESSIPPAPSLAAPSETPASLPVAERPQPLSLARIEARIPKMLQGQALRPIVHQVIAMAGNPNVDASSIAQILRSDMEMSAKVIASANSAFYKRRNVMIRNLADAISVIGLNNTRNLAMSLAVGDHFGGESSDPSLALPGLWGHSISVAHLSQELAKLTRTCDPDQAFVVGLLHDLGRRLMADHLPDYYRLVMQSPLESSQQLHEIERAIVGGDHGLFGGIVTERWGCPQFLSRAVRLHHSASIQTDEGEDPLGGLLRILRLADSMAIAFGFAGDNLEELPIVPCGWLGKTIKNPVEFRDSVLYSLRETQAMIMSRSNLSVELPSPWVGEFEQILVLGTVAAPLEPLQLLISHAYQDVAATSAGRVDRSRAKTLVLADLRGVEQITDAGISLSWLAREKAPVTWPVLVVSDFGPEQIGRLGLGGRRVAMIKPPLRPALIRTAVESLAAANEDASQLVAA